MKTHALSLILAFAASTSLSAETPATLPASSVPLPTGRSIVDPTGPSANLGSMPQNILLSPDHQFAITTSSGYRDHLTSIRISDGSAISSIDYPNNRRNKTNGLYYGIALSRNNTLYAAQGANHSIALLTLQPDGSLHPEKQFTTAPSDFPTGLALDQHNHLFVTHNDPSLPGQPFGAPASLSLLDATTGHELGRYTFNDPLHLSNFPLAVVVTNDGARAYVTSERDSSVYILNTSDPAHIHLETTLTTGTNPTALLLNKSQSTLFVANAHSDTVSIIDTASLKVTGTILLRPQIAKDLAGATPLGLALSENEHMLYVALGDMNAVAVVDLAEKGGPELEGYIPTGWYPTSLAVTGRQLLVTNAKGNFPRVPHDFSTPKHVISPLWLFEGTLWDMPIPHHADLDAMTKTVLADARLTPATLNAPNPLQSVSRAAGKIQHVIYVVKENRTYDQILGDLPQGNGDLSRNLFPREVTPNEHALAERFVLLDNFYDSGEVSGDGWTWSTQAQANEYTIRNVPYNYSTRGRTFDFEGANNEYPTGGFPATGPDGKPLSDDPRFVNGAPAVPDVAASPGGHLWDLARKHNLTYRNFGMYVTGGVFKNGKTIIPNNYPTVQGLQPGGHDLDGITDLDFRCFDLQFPDSDAPATLAAQKHDDKFLWPKHSFGKDNVPSRIAEFKRELNLMIAKDPTGNAVPNLITLRLGTDHTLGARANSPTPTCMIADNDYAIGELVDAVSHSPIWNSTAILILEDDAQNGPDHVDAHRSICFCISPWIKKNSVDHSFQNTVSTIKTIESLLNLPPMCQYDAAAPVINDFDTAPNNSEPYTAIFPQESIIAQRNAAGGRNDPDFNPEQPNNAPTIPDPLTPTTQNAANLPLNSNENLVAASDAMDFSHADQAPADILNQIIWKSVRGPNSEMPPTPHVIGSASPKDDDDN